MGAIAAVINKKGENASETVVTMLKTLALKQIEAYGLASSSKVIIRRRIEPLQEEDMKSQIMLGHAFQRILQNEKPQPIKLDSATAVFEGRICSSNNSPDAEKFAESIHPDYHKETRILVAKACGDFAFAVADSERVIAGRDALGARPLYYAENTDIAALASERKALWKIGLENAASFPPGHVAVVDKHGFIFESASTLSTANPDQTTIEESAQKLQKLLEESVEEKTRDLSSIAVAFSGGLDSSIIAFLAKNTGLEVHLIHVSLENQSETKYALRVAEELGLPIYVSVFNSKDVEEALPETLWLIEEADPVKASIGIPVRWAASKASEMRLKTMLAGQGADEFFGGYERYVDLILRQGGEKAREMIFKDITSIHETNLERDFKICNACNVELRLPFVTSCIAEFALKLPIEQKLEPKPNTLRKLVLREVAKNLGLPSFVASKPKKAMQYTTGISNALRKLARKRDMRLKEYLEKVFREKVRESLK
jgi:asparagine synthase (glutamine-hydrolysing)